MQTVPGEVVRPRSGAAELDAAEFLALLAGQADAVELVRAACSEAARAVPHPPEFDRTPAEGLVDPLELARRDLWFRAEGIREGWFTHYARWVGWWVDTAQLALQSAAGRRTVELARVTALRPPQAFGVADGTAADPVRSWGESWSRDSLPRLMSTAELGALLARTGGGHPENVLAAHRSVGAARRAGDLALEQEETGSAGPDTIDRNWNHYGLRHQLACEFARSVLDHLR